MFKIFIDFIFTIYQCIIATYMLKCQIPQRKHTLIYELSTVTLMVIYLLGIQYFSIPLPDTLFFLFPFILIKITSDEPLLKCFFWTTLDIFLYMGTLSLVSGLFNITIAINGSTTADFTTLLQYGFVGNSALTIVAIIATKIITTHLSIAKFELSLLISTLVINFSISEIFFILRNNLYDNIKITIGSTCSFISLILTIVLYERLTNITWKKQQAELNLRTSSLISEYQNELKSIYTNMLAEQHDLKHRITVAEELISSMHITEDSKSKLLEYIKYENPKSTFITGNIAVDALLKVKSTMMQNVGIEFEYIEYPLNDLPICEQDFCMLLGNLLDNAIEGVMRLPASETERTIRLSISKVWEMFFISCSNKANIQTIKRNGKNFISSKSNSALHGFGIQNMTHIVEKSGGSIEFIANDELFSVEIMLGGKRPCY